ncbi:class I SAM-dependent methyltransferase [Heyndrickxia acidicola]|uniref:Methyltransferase domain-containing protein n=1 Tax=Heyndrickxia acidicola TaxID=209389 RepID=A0ABU6MLC6_9BACI|nr:class I SAM-dependent methyltransferase [Heyndrickxia acidicola]MED1203850.1 methyltransferase domain-containing protein [Heyndrickxia acidicola]
MKDQREQNNEYRGNYYEEIGNYIGGEGYLQYGFTKGTLQEVEFLIERMRLKPGSAILDVGCGPGRHSLELARRGFDVTGVDISSEFVRFAEEQAAKEKLNAKFIKMDARSLQLDKTFNGAICLCEGAFGLAGSLESHRDVLRGINGALVTGGLFVLTVINAFNLVRNLTSFEVFNAYTCTIKDTETVKSPNGEEKQVDIFTTAFTYRELALLLEDIGFEVIDAYGCTAGEFSEKSLEADDMEIMIVARKI